MLEWIAAEVWEWGSVQVIVLLLGCFAAACALWLTRGGRAPTQQARWLATIGLKAAFAVLALTMFGLADMHRQVLEIQGFLPSSAPPSDQKSTMLGAVLTDAPVVLGRLVAVMLPVVTWVWIRVHRPGPAHRWLRRLAIASAGVLGIALWVAGQWAIEYVFPRGFSCGSGCGVSGIPGIDSLFESLERLRALVVLTGMGLGAAAVWFAVAQARRGLTLGTREWAVLLGLLGLATAAKLWTADERRDTRAYIRGEEARNGFGREPFSRLTPTLDHCTYDWTGSDFVFVVADPDLQPVESLIHEIELIEVCDGPSGIIAIVAEPTLPIARVAIALQTMKAKAWLRVGVVSLQPELLSRETTGEFVHYRSCVVELTLGVEGIPLSRFSTWGELAEAADGAEGKLVINPGT